LHIGEKKLYRLLIVNRLTISIRFA
jgi:hypothetical protein